MRWRRCARHTLHGRLSRALRVLGPSWSASPVRRLVQSACLIGFLVLFFYVCWPYGSKQYAQAFRAKEIVDAELFLILDPLVSISTAVAARMLVWSLAAAAAVILVCLLLPRAFCGYVCPLGTLFDVFDWLIGRCRVRTTHHSLITAHNDQTVRSTHPAHFLGWLGNLKSTAKRVWLWHPPNIDSRPSRVPATHDSRWWVNTRYYLLAGVMVAAVFGVLLSGFVAAIPVLTRAMLFIAAPAQTGLQKDWYLVPPGNVGHVISILLVLLMLCLGLLGRRFWCSYVCPTGALLSLFSILRLTERRVTGACVKCGRCVEACSFAAINDDFSTRFLNCTFCRTCGGVCPVGAIEFTWRRGRRSNVQGSPRIQAKRVRGKRCTLGVAASSEAWRWSYAHSEEPSPRPSALRLPPIKSSKDDQPPSHTPSKADLSRRRVLVGLGSAAAVGVGLPLAVGNAPVRGDVPIRPPGSVPEDKFLQLCVRCGQCIKVCPNNVLQPAGIEHGFNGLWTPKVVADWSGCEPSCNNCGQVCPTGAVRALPLEEKRVARIGLAEVDREACLPYAGRGECQLCVDECRMAAYNAIEFLRVGGRVDEKGEPVEGSGFLAPVVREDRCVGCGLCQMRCRGINVKSKKLLPRSAIRVVAGAGKEDRIVSGSYLALREERAGQRRGQQDRLKGEDGGTEYLPDFLR